MEDIERIFPIDKILVNRKRHMYGIVNMVVRSFYHMIYIDRVVNHCKSNISNGILDIYREYVRSNGKVQKKFDLLVSIEIEIFIGLTIL